MSDKIKAETGSDPVKQVVMDYPSNSFKNKTEVKKERPVQEKITTGMVIKKKKSFFKKFTEVFVGEDVGSVGEYILFDVLVPAAKATLSDMVSGGIEMILFGETRPSSRTRRDKNKTYYNYAGASSASYNKPRQASTQNRTRHDFGDIILETRGEAEAVLAQLGDLIEDYGQATVGDLYDMVDITSSYTDTKYGWTNINTAYPERVREGYLLKLPRTVLLD